MEFIIYSSNLDNEQLLERNIFISPQAKICDGVKLYFGVKVYGESYIGGGSELHSNTEIDNSRVDKNCKVYSTLIKDSEIEANCTIKPFTHITNTKIGENGLIGNFTCIDNSSFGLNLNIYSLCSIRNVDVGNNVIIKSGVYCEPGDSSTINIGDNVIIGPNSSLINPVIISDNVIIDANSAVSKDVEANQRATNNIKQTNKWL
ncbi:MAG: hypothetical protein J6Q15_01110 [Clostridia bacterium]|nr:hypothetical protein [Clostridia bacterium]